MTYLNLIPCAQEAVTIAGLKMLSLERSACKVASSLASGTWLVNSSYPDMKRSLNYKGGLLFICVHNMIYAEPLLCFWESRILVCARQGVPL